MNMFCKAVVQRMSKEDVKDVNTRAINMQLLSMIINKLLFKMFNYTSQSTSTLLRRKIYIKREDKSLIKAQKQLINTSL